MSIGYQYLNSTCSTVGLWQNGKATMATILIGANLFNAQHAAKKVLKTTPEKPHSTSTFPDASTGPSPPFCAPTHNVSHFNNALPHYLLPIPPPFPFYGFPPAPYFGQLGFGYSNIPPPPQPLSAHPHSSPPPTGLSFDEFCTAYKVSAASKEGLVSLGFKMGDDSSVVMQAENKSAGFQPLGRDCVHNAY